MSSAAATNAVSVSVSPDLSAEEEKLLPVEEVIKQYDLNKGKELSGEAKQALEQAKKYAREDSDALALKYSQQAACLGNTEALKILGLNYFFQYAEYELIDLRSAGLVWGKYLSVSKVPDHERTQMSVMLNSRYTAAFYCYLSSRDQNGIRLLLQNYPEEFFRQLNKCTLLHDPNELRNITAFFRSILGNGHFRNLETIDMIFVTLARFLYKNGDVAGFFHFVLNLDAAVIRTQDKREIAALWEKHAVELLAMFPKAQDLSAQRKQQIFADMIKAAEIADFPSDNDSDSEEGNDSDAFESKIETDFSAAFIPEQFITRDFFEHLVERFIVLAQKTDATSTAAIDNLFANFIKDYLQEKAASFGVKWVADEKATASFASVDLTSAATLTSTVSAVSPSDGVSEAIKTSPPITSYPTPVEARGRVEQYEAAIQAATNLQQGTLSGAHAQQLSNASLSPTLS